MSDRRAAEATLAPAGLAGLLVALRPRVPPETPPPDLDAIHQAGWEAGFAAGAAAAEAGLAPLRVRLAEAATAIEAACTIDSDRLRPLFVALVTAIAEAVLAAELAAGVGAVAPLVTAALAMVRPGEVPTLVAHPETLAALAPHLPAIATAGDGRLAIDAFRVTGPDFVIETALSRRLAEIVAGLA